MKIKLSLLIILTGLIHSAHPDTHIEDRADYFPIIAGTHIQTYAPSIDDTGNYISFLTPYPLNQKHQEVFNGELGNSQVYLYNKNTRSIELLSVDSNSNALKYGYCRETKTSLKGLFTIYLSYSREIVPFEQSWYGIQCYVRDRINKRNHHITIGIDGLPADGDCSDIDISSNGRFISFSSTATNLTLNDTEDDKDIYVYDMQEKTMQCVSKGSSEIPADSTFFTSVISGNGQYVAFKAYSDGWFDGTVQIRQWPTQIIVKDIQTGEIDIVTRRWDGEFDTGHPEGPPAISNDGRWIAFISTSKLLQDMPDEWAFLYLFDRNERIMEMITPVDEYPAEYPMYFSLEKYIVLMSGNGNYVYWYQGEGNHEELNIYRYDRINMKIDKIVNSVPAPRQEQDAGSWWNTYGADVNEDGSSFVFSTGAPVFAPLGNQGHYEPVFQYPIYPDYWTVCLQLFQSSGMVPWRALR